RGLDFARHKNAADAAVGRAVVLVDPCQRGFEALAAERIVAYALEPPALVRYPSPAVVAGRKIGAAAEPDDLGEQRILHAELTAIFDEGRHPVADELGHGEGGVELEGGRRSRVAVL